MEINKTELKKLVIEAVGLPNVTPEEIEDTMILFGPQSVLGLDSIDAVTFMAELRSTFDISSEIEISSEHFLTIEKMVNWLGTLETVK